MAEHGFMSTALSSLSPSAVALPASSLSTTSTETSSTIGCPTCKSFPEVSTPGTTTTSFGNSERKCAACGLNCGKPALLDLFSGAGGAARGYQQAGFCVLGVDLAPQPHYIGCEFVQADAMTYPLDGFDAIHASPPCHDKTALRHVSGEDGTGWMVAEIMQRLRATGLPYIVENVVGAEGDMGDHWFTLCGSSFGLSTVSAERGEVWLRRHRRFASNVAVLVRPCECRGKRIIGVYGNGDGGGRGWKGSMNDRRSVMGIDWMTRDELSQAIPPAYTEYLGQFLLAAVSEAA